MRISREFQERESSSPRPPRLKAFSTSAFHSAHRSLSMTSSPITVFSDGASKGNPGPGGWGVVSVTPDGQVTELGGSDPHTTNNRMELTGAIEALAHLENVPGPIALYTDST